MAEQMRPSSPAKAPDPASSYERAKPDKEAGMGRLDNNKATPTVRQDKMEETVTNRQPPRQLNAHDVVDQRDARPLDRPTGEGRGGAPASSVNARQPDHSMKDEEPLGWDQAPEDIHDPRDQRQPRTDGKGGTP